ncbi:MAG: RagB/SusD family nutrient uptake outer membrane protein [Bacteroidales bacterium]|nr:RagB/SusD family nutrient uptake outer membrane protein [Bacteroidales bacterium]
MKKSLYILSAAIVLCLSSCGKDFITAVHNSSEPLDEFFINEDRMYQGLVAAYDPLEWFDYFYQYNSLPMVADIMADDIYCGGSNEGDQPVLVKTHYYTATATEVCNQIWTIAYSGINRCYHVLEYVDGIPGMSDQTKSLYKAETDVLLAYYYNILWKFWGNIPYYDENLTAPYFATQLGHDEVYEKIVERIEEALKYNVLPMKASGGSEGRITKAMAYMLYAEVVMYQNDKTRYPKALEYMKEIISSGQYALVSDYASIWAETGEWSSESIWEINYTSEGAVRDWGAPIAAGGSVYPTLIGIPGGVPGYFDDGWGFSPVAKSAYEMYEEGDIRRDGGILNIDAFCAEKGLSYDHAQDRWQCTGYYLLKYIARTNGNHGYLASNTLNYGNNIRVYRYAETLLNAAELSLALGQDDSSYLAEVRNRAHCSDKGTSLEDIIEERHKEFVGEGKRYWDLVRTGMASTVLKASNHLYRQVDWTESKKYWPIPQSERDKDPNLVQNDY